MSIHIVHGTSNLCIFFNKLIAQKDWNCNELKHASVCCVKYTILILKGFVFNQFTMIHNFSDVFWVNDGV